MAKLVEQNEMMKSNAESLNEKYMKETERGTAHSPER